MIWLLFFAGHSNWSIWFTAEILEGNIQAFWVINTRQKHSWLVNCLLDLRPIIFPWIRQRIGNGETCYFWTGNWSPMGTMSDHLNSSGSRRFPIARDATLAELWEDGSWILPNARSERELQAISFLSTITLTDDSDYLEWVPDNVKRQSFSTGEIYNLLKFHQPKVAWVKEVWFSGGIPKHKFLAWLMVLNRCPTRDRLLNWGLQTDPNCLFCNVGNESIEHCFFFNAILHGLFGSRLQTSVNFNHQGPGVIFYKD